MNYLWLFHRHNLGTGAVLGLILFDATGTAVVQTNNTFSPSV